MLIHRLLVASIAVAFTLVGCGDPNRKNPKTSVVVDPETEKERDEAKAEAEAAKKAQEQAEKELAEAKAASADGATDETPADDTPSSANANDTESSTNDIQDSATAEDLAAADQEKAALANLATYMAYVKPTDGMTVSEAVAESLFYDLDAAEVGAEQSEIAIAEVDTAIALAEVEVATAEAKIADLDKDLKALQASLDVTDDKEAIVSKTIESFFAAKAELEKAQANHSNLEKAHADAVAKLEKVTAQVASLAEQIEQTNEAIAQATAERNNNPKVLDDKTFLDTFAGLEAKLRHAKEAYEHLDVAIPQLDADVLIAGQLLTKATKVVTQKMIVVGKAQAGLDKKLAEQLAEQQEIVTAAQASIAELQQTRQEQVTAKADYEQTTAETEALIATFEGQFGSIWDSIRGECAVEEESDQGSAQSSGQGAEQGSMQGVDGVGDEECSLDIPDGEIQDVGIVKNG